MLFCESQAVSKLLLVAMCVAFGWGSAVAQDFRVELFSGHAYDQVSLQAGSAVAQLCNLRSPRDCLTLPAGEKAACARAGTQVRCDSPHGSREFPALSVQSSAPLEVIVAAVSDRRLPGGTPWRAPATIGDRRYSQTSSLEIRPSPRGLEVIVPVDLEAYVAGVLAGEAAILHSEPARQAMAIVARSWAVRWRGRHQAEGFDFCSLTHCQAYRPTLSSQLDAQLDEAVRSTRGQVLQFRGEAVDPYFSADCGGMTEAAGNVWADRAQPYLLSLRDPYCAGSAHASWRSVLTLPQVEEILRSGVGLPLAGRLTRITIAKTDSSGRAQILLVEAGTRREIDANEFRYAVDRRLGWATLKSNLYTISQRDNSLVFNGRGLGHGVGLCQAGADEMGRIGRSAQEILGFYFPGATVELRGESAANLVQSSEHFELVFPADQQVWAPPALDTLERVRRELGRRAEVITGRVRVRAYATTAEFIKATGQPGWTAASNDGQSITLQPLGLLARKEILETTLRHEFIHLVVHRACGAGVPHWYEEGMVLYLAHERIAPGHAELAPGRSLEEAITKPHSEAEMRAAYAEALARVRRIAEQRGEAALWGEDDSKFKIQDSR
jgi:stage II sporulation protein D